MKTTDARKQASEIVSKSLEDRITELKKTDEFKQLEKQVNNFVDNGSDNYHMGEDGMLVSSERIYLDRSLCTDEDGNPDYELAEAILKECSDIPYFHQDDYSQGFFEWVMEQCHGDPCIVTYPNKQHSYSVYCPDLGLKINRIESEEHGLMIVEQAMREHEFFPDVVSVDDCGFATHLTIPEAIQNATDNQLAEMIQNPEKDGTA